MTDKRERIISLIRHLREKTVDRGCTEQEALAAAEKVSNLMAEYQLSLTDIREIKSDTYGAMSRSVGGGSAKRRHWHETKITWTTIAKFCDVEAWTAGDALVFFGARSDCEIAHYLADLIKNTADNGWQAYRRSFNGWKVATDKTARAAFMLGFSRRIIERLQELKAERDAKTGQVEQSRALVVAKSAEVARRFEQYTKEKGMNLKTTTVRRTARDAQAHAAGKRAGDRASLGKGVGGTSNQGLLR